MTGTRQRLLDYLAMERSATAREIGRALQITPADARHHLTVLEREGIVAAVNESGPATSKAGRGRPARRYSLASFVLRDNFDLLAGALLSASLQAIPAPEREDYLRAVAGRVAAKVAGAAPGEVRPLGSLTARLVEATQRLNELGYPARWEARPSAPRLILERRPFAALLEQYPEVGELDLYLIEALLGAEVRRGKEKGSYVVAGKSGG